MHHQGRYTISLWYSRKPEKKVWTWLQSKDGFWWDKALKILQGEVKWYKSPLWQKDPRCIGFRTKEWRRWDWGLERQKRKKSRHFDPFQRWEIDPWLSYRFHSEWSKFHSRDSFKQSWGCFSEYSFRWNGRFWSGNVDRLKTYQGGWWLKLAQRFNYCQLKFNNIHNSRKYEEEKRW